jgi:hypothetical protein
MVMSYIDAAKDGNEFGILGDFTGPYLLYVNFYLRLCFIGSAAPATSTSDLLARLAKLLAALSTQHIAFWLLDLDLRSAASPHAR